MKRKYIFFIAIIVFKADAFSSYIELIHQLGNNFRISALGCNNKEFVFLSKTLSSHGFQNQCMKKFHYSEASASLFRRRFFIINLNCKHSYNHLIQANEEKLFASPNIWLAMYKKKHFTELLHKMFSNLTILVDSNFNLAELYANGDIYLRKIYRRHNKDAVYVTEDYGMWNRAPLNITTRKNLGINLTACLVITHNESLNHLIDKRDKHIDSITKVNYIVISILASIYNITLQFSIRDTWGYKTNNSKWTGMIGELVKKEADIGGTSLFMIKERLDVIDYIARITPTRAKFVFRQPKLSSIRNVYILPFDRKVWISTIALIGVFMLSIFFLIKWERAQSVFLTPHLTTLEMNDSLSDVAFVTIGAICQQGAAAILCRTPGRIATFVLYLSLMFIYVSYSANIVALLQTASSSIRTLEDLLNSRISVGVDDTVYNRFFFENAEDSIRKSLYQRKIAPPGKLSNYMPMEEGVNRMRKSLFAFHMETGAGYKLVSETFKEDEKCGLQEIEFLQVMDPWLAIQKNSPYKEILKVGLYLLQENGIHQRENSLIYTRKPVCSSKVTTFFSVGILDCYPAAAILAGGIAASVAIFIIELYLNCRLS